MAVSGVSYDSRTVRPGDLFVAIRGTRQDGSRFIEDSLKRGAAAVVAETAPSATLPVPFVRVADSRKALARISAAYFDHPARGMCLIGVTGTNGKTTTTLILESILKAHGGSVGILGTLAYRWAGEEHKAPRTTPESLDLQRLFHDMRRDGVTHVVMEVSSHALALHRVEGCVFNAGVFTNLSQDHLDFHSGMEDYFEAKERLFREHLREGENAFPSVVNSDDPYGKRLAETGLPALWTYSLKPEGGRVWVRDALLTPAGLKAEVVGPTGVFAVGSPLVGRLNLYNVMAAVTTALALGVPQEAIAEGVAALNQVDGRLQRVPVPASCGFDVIVDYAHTPDAMEKSLGCVKEMTRGRLLAVFGCGGDRDRAKRPIMGRVAAELADLVILTSDNPRSEEPAAIIREIEAGVLGVDIPYVNGSGVLAERGYTIEADRRRAIEKALSWARPGDVVFVGGKGHETYQIIGLETLAFDDRKVVVEALEANAW